MRSMNFSLVGSRRNVRENVWLCEEPEGEGEGERCQKPPYRSSDGEREERREGGGRERERGRGKREERGERRGERGRFYIHTHT